MLIWIATGVGALVLAFGIFLAASLIDEDVNHWNWPSDGGPGTAWTVRWLALSVVAGSAIAFGLVGILRAML